MNFPRWRSAPLLLVVVACGSSAPSPEAPPQQNATDGPTATATPTIETSSECFDGGGVIKLPNGQQVGTLTARAKRTLHPDRNEIVEEFENLTPRPDRFVVTIKVDGDKFTMTEAKEAFVGEGTLTGDAWKWSEWHSTSTLPDGMRVESHDKRTETGLAVSKKVFDKDGTLQVTIEETFATVPCS